MLFVGITCGLSAPYVAGQIAYSMAQPNFSTVLIGFNPTELARNAPVENWDQTCFSVWLLISVMQFESHIEAVVRVDLH